MVLASIKAVVGWMFTQVNVLYHMFLSPISGRTHKDRLESFYSHQATGYDEFRKKLLHGREDMLKAVFSGSRSVPQDAVWVDFGGGTGTTDEPFWQPFFSSL